MQKQIPPNDVIGSSLPQRLSVAKQISVSSTHDDVVTQAEQEKLAEHLSDTKKPAFSPKMQKSNVERPKTLSSHNAVISEQYVEKAPKINERSYSLPENRRNLIKISPMYQINQNLSSPEDHVTIINNLNLHQSQPWYQPLISQTREKEQDDYCIPGCTIDDDYDYQDLGPQILNTSIASSANLFSVNSDVYY